jgi:hypothetical protein
MLRCWTAISFALLTVRALAQVPDAAGEWQVVLNQLNIAVLVMMTNLISCQLTDPRKSKTGLIPTLL